MNEYTAERIAQLAKAHFAGREFFSIPRPEYENVIAQDARASYRYAMEALQGRFEEGESSIMTDTRRTYMYARNVLKSRWEDGEEYLKSQNDAYWEAYRRYFGLPRLPEWYEHRVNTYGSMDNYYNQTAAWKGERNE